MKRTAEAVSPLHGQLARLSVTEALAFGFLVGQATGAGSRPALRDSSCFLMGLDLEVTGASGDSVLRLPWFEQGMFVGRQVPDIHEMPANVRTPAVNHYRAALKGERGRFLFASYGHAFTVDAVPVFGDDDRVRFVLGIAVPHPSRLESPTPSLTPRETEVMALAADGMTAREIAARLFISDTTVRSHLENIYEKLGARGKSDAVARALRLGLIN